MVLILDMMMVGVKIVMILLVQVLDTRPLAWVIGPNAPNPFFDHHLFLDFSLITHNPQPHLLVLLIFFPSWFGYENMLIGLDQIWNHHFKLNG